MKKIIVLLILLSSNSVLAYASRNVEITGMLMAVNEEIVKIKMTDKVLNVPRSSLPKGSLANSTVTISVDLAKLIRMNKK